MPTTTKPKPAAPKADRKPKRQHSWRPTNIGQQVQANVKDSLRRKMEDFLEDGRPDEMMFMSKVFNERDNITGSGYPKGLRNHDVPLFSAIESAIDDDVHTVMLLPDGAMEEKVAEFISGLEKQAAADRGVLAHHQKSWSQIREMRQADLAHYMARFCAECTDSDLFFLETVMARWADILEYQDRDQPESPIMSALQFELDHQHWVVNVPAGIGVGESRTLVRRAAGKDWMGKLLIWIAEKHDSLTPCDVGKEAFTYQREFDEQAKAAQAA